MAIKLSDITKTTKTITVDIGASEPLEVEYRVNAYTPEVESEITGANDKPARALSNILQKLVARWTLVNDSGEMYPTNGDLPLQVMLSVFAAIANDMRPNPPSGAN